VIAGKGEDHFFAELFAPGGRHILAGELLKPAEGAFRLGLAIETGLNLGNDRLVDGADAIKGALQIGGRRRFHGEDSSEKFLL
jgi:hypothetical protein